jgi:2-oxo-3-hexenedioate decarboxylase
VVDAEKWAERLLDAERRRVAMAPISDSEPGLTLADGYAIQAEALSKRVAAGERVVGAKLGLTSAAKQRQNGSARRR